MRILNETHWRTEQIKRLIFRVAQDELDPGQLRHAQITIKYRKNGWLKMGHCTYGTPRNPRVIMTLLLPRTGPVDLPAYALIIAHELAHARGGRHREMYKTNRYWWLEGWQERYGYASGFPIEEVVETPKPSREDALLQRRTEAVSHAQAMLAKAVTRAKRADTIVKKWRVRLKAAERRIKQPPLSRSPEQEPMPETFSHAAHA